MTIAERITAVAKSLKQHLGEPEVEVYLSVLRSMSLSAHACESALNLVARTYEVFPTPRGLSELAQKFSERPSGTWFIISRPVMGYDRPIEYAICTDGQAPKLRVGEFMVQQVDGSTVGYDEDPAAKREFMKQLRKMAQRHSV